MSFVCSAYSALHGEMTVIQKRGVPVPKGLWTALEKARNDPNELQLLYSRIKTLSRSKQPHFDSLELPDIRRDRPRHKSKHLVCPVSAIVKDKIHGGWLGRAAGCMLGKPLELSLTLPEIKRYLGREYPIRDYLRYSTARRIRIALAKGKSADSLPIFLKPCSREHIAYATYDDDLNYTTVNLLLLEKKGFSFTTRDVGMTWAEYLPPLTTWGAETAAFVNFLWGVPVEEIPTHLNPYRWQIGAQIRADTFGYVCPGQPRKAAELAYRDARFSHAADGIYGAMFVSAMIAAAFSVKRIDEIIEQGLGQIPQNSRLAKLVKNTLFWWHISSGDWEAVYARIKEATGYCSAGDTENNAAYVVNALLASGGDYEKAITIAVMQGHDTDCNGATAGSIMGVFLGTHRLPRKWISPLNDRLRTSLSGLSEVRLSEMARRTAHLALGKKKNRSGS